MSMHSAHNHMAAAARTLRHDGDKTMTATTARRCVAACVDYLWHDDQSPEASQDLQEAVKKIEQDAYGRGRAEAVAERLVGK